MDPLLVSVQYKLLNIVGKHLILPYFVNSIDDIALKLVSLKNQKSESLSALKNEVEDSDLTNRILTIKSFLDEKLYEDEYDSKTVHMHLCGIYDVLEQIQKELNILTEEEEYKNTSWFYWTIEWWWYKNRVNFENFKRQIKLLMSRYKDLLDVLQVIKNTNNNKK